MMSTNDSAMQISVSVLMRRALPTEMTGAPIHRILSSGYMAPTSFVIAMSESTSAALFLVSVLPCGVS